jgi:hypothetical protein
MGPCLLQSTKGLRNKDQEKGKVEKKQSGRNPRGRRKRGELQSGIYRSWRFECNLTYTMYPSQRKLRLFGCQKMIRRGKFKKHVLYSSLQLPYTINDILYINLKCDCVSAWVRQGDSHNSSWGWGFDVLFGSFIISRRLYLCIFLISLPGCICVSSSFLCRLPKFVLIWLIED